MRTSARSTGARDEAANLINARVSGAVSSAHDRSASVAGAGGNVQHVRRGGVGRISAPPIDDDMLDIFLNATKRNTGLIAAEQDRRVLKTSMRAGNMFEESEQKAEQGQSTKWILLEDSKYRLYWDFVIALLIVFYMFVVPLRLAFATTCEDDAFAQGQQGWFWLDLTADIFFMIDIGLNFRTGYREPGGGLVTSPKQIAVHYLGGWFIIDLTASVPLSLLVLATEGPGGAGDTGGGAALTSANKVLRFVRFAKLTKLVRIAKMGRIFRRLQRTHLISGALTRIFRLVVILVSMWHIMACGYWAVSNVGGFCARGPNTEWETLNPQFYSWGVEFNQVMYSGFDECVNSWSPWEALKREPLQTQYTQAFYWALIVTTGVGRDVIPQSDLEASYTILVIITGVFMYATVIGSISSSISTMDAARIARAEKMERIGQYLKKHTVPPALREEIFDYYDFLFETHQRERGEELSDLPQMLRMKLDVLMQRSVLRGVPLFRVLNAACIVVLVQVMETKVALPGERLVDQGEIGLDLFVLQRGRVIYVMAPEPDEAPRSPGMRSQVDEQLRTIFNAIDTDGSGTLDIHELRTASRAAGHDLQEDELRRMLGGDEDGTVDFNKFRRVTEVLKGSKKRDSEMKKAAEKHRARIAEATSLAAAPREGRNSMPPLVRRSSAEGSGLSGEGPAAPAEWLKIFDSVARRTEEFIVGEVAKGSSFGEAAMLKRPHPYSCRSEIISEVLSIDVDEIGELWARAPPDFAGRVESSVRRQKLECQSRLKAALAKRHQKADGKRNSIVNLLPQKLRRPSMRRKMEKTVSETVEDIQDNVLDCADDLYNRCVTCCRKSPPKSPFGKTTAETEALQTAAAIARGQLPAHLAGMSNPAPAAAAPSANGGAGGLPPLARHGSGSATGERTRSNSRRQMRSNSNSNGGGGGVSNASPSKVQPAPPADATVSTQPGAGAAAEAVRRASGASVASIHEEPVTPGEPGTPDSSAFWAKELELHSSKLEEENMALRLQLGQASSQQNKNADLLGELLGQLLVKNASGRGIDETVSFGGLQVKAGPSTDGSLSLTFKQPSGGGAAGGGAGTDTPPRFDEFASLLQGGAPPGSAAARAAAVAASAAQPDSSLDSQRRPLTGDEAIAAAMRANAGKKADAAAAAALANVKANAVRTPQAESGVGGGGSLGGVRTVGPSLDALLKKKTSGS